LAPADQAVLAAKKEAGLGTPEPALNSILERQAEAG
jgi:hypothetical protein